MWRILPYQGRLTMHIISSWISYKEVAYILNMTKLRDYHVLFGILFLLCSFHTGLYIRSVQYYYFQFVLTALYIEWEICYFTTMSTYNN